MQRSSAGGNLRDRQIIRRDAVRWMLFLPEADLIHAVSSMAHSIENNQLHAILCAWHHDCLKQTWGKL
jgi:hypothetical protein